MRCDNCQKSLYDCYIDHNKLELISLSRLAKYNNLCPYLVKYIAEFAFNKKHIIHYRRKHFYYYDEFENSEDDYDSDDNIHAHDDRMRCGFDISNHTYTICERCMIIGIDYYYSYKSRLPFLRDDSYYFVWSVGNYGFDISENHYIKNKYILPTNYVCDFYRTQLPLLTSDGKLLITEN